LSRHRIFTITGGRTGTAWLAALVGENSGCAAVHEPIGVDDIGTRTPDIRSLRHFNTYGMTPVVEQFWRTKFSLLPDVPEYFESNHILAKAGLVEALAAATSDDRVTILLLRRGWEKQVSSYLDRDDFRSAANVWQWYLDPAYPRRIVDPSRLTRFGMTGAAIWYAAEIEARQEYYRRLYGDRFAFIDCTLEEITTPAGASALMTLLGFRPDPILPERRNANAGRPTQERIERLRRLLARIRFDPVESASEFIEAGGSLHRPAAVRKD